MIAILCPSIGPYHAARYNALSAWSSYDLVIVQVAASQSQYRWENAVHGIKGAGVVTLFERELDQVPARARVKAVLNTLDQWRPDVLVTTGYSQPEMRAAARWALGNGAWSIMMTATWAGDKRRWFVLERAKSWWCKKYYHALFLPGIRSVAYFAGLGVPVNRIWRGVDVVDNVYFASSAEQARQERARVQSLLELPDRYFLCVARLAREKNLGRLLSAFARYRRRGGKWSLVIAGAGPDEGRLKSMAQEIGDQSIHFKGWVSYRDLPKLYALASAFVLPSISEPWGLAVNEAMACGLPVLVSRKCGCLPELCWRGLNGYDFDPHNEEELAKLMLRISSGEVDLLEMGKASLRIIANFTPQTWARTLVDIVETLRRK